MTSLEVCGAGLKHAGWQDYAFAVYTQPLGSSWMVFARKQILASLEMTRVWVCGSLPRHLTPCHSEEPERRGICCFSNFGKPDFSLPREMTMRGDLFLVSGARKFAAYFLRCHPDPERSEGGRIYALQIQMHRSFAA